MSARVTIPRGALVALVGPAGSGKSTFASRHFVETQIVSTDHCRGMISDDPLNQAVSGRAIRLFHQIIQDRLHLGRTTVADATNLTKDARRQLLDLADRYQRPAVAVAFMANRQTCLAWDARRPESVGESVIDRHLRQMGSALGSIEQEGWGRVYMLRSSALSSGEVAIE